MLCVPMLRDEHVIGVIDGRARQAGQFADKEVALLQTFADQAVIAIENVRLFNETQGGARAADRHRRSPAGHQQLGGRHGAGVRQDPPQLRSTCSPREQLGIFLVKDDGQVHAGAFRGSALDAIARTFPKPLRTR